MSCVTLQVGQCGNQIGFQLWKFLKEEINVNNNTYFNRNTERARCILVDSEPKVVEKPFAKAAHPLFNILSPSLTVKSNSGRSNNWATGYADKPEKNSSLSSQTMELLRREVEQCDYFKNCVLIHSLAGGTGSGLGSKLLQLIRDEYPICFITTASVLPFESGDTPLQDYNSIFCLSHIQSYADACVYFENDEVYRVVQNFNIREPSTHNLNQFIAYSLCNLFIPSRNADFDLSGFFCDLTPSDSFKFIETKAFPFVIDKQKTWLRDSSWNAVLDASMKHFNKHEGDGLPSTICAKACFRGDDAVNELDRQIKTIFSKVSSMFRPVPWVDKDYLKISLVPEKAMKNIYQIDRMLTIAVNRVNAIRPMIKLLASARSKFLAGAYLHWYEKYQCNEANFVEAFEVVEKIIKDYQNSIKINSV